MPRSTAAFPRVVSMASRPLSPGERDELIALGIVSADGERQCLQREDRGERFVARQAVHAPSVLNEAYNYAKTASFTRGVRFDLGDKTMLLISGTASVDEAGLTRYVGDFRGQLWRTYRNISTLLESEGATWHDVMRTTCYLRDIERDYSDFNDIRTAFFQWHRLDPLPASTAIQARLCREDLLVEIEAIAVTAK